MRASKLKIKDIKVTSFITTNHQTRVLKASVNGLIVNFSPKTENIKDTLLVSKN